MTDETLSAAAEPETPAIEPADEPINLNAPETPASNEAPEAQPDDLEEFEWEGKPIRAPKGLKDGVLRQADYTRKTQEVAARRQELDAREQQIAQQARATEEELTVRASLHNINSELKKFENWGWNEYQAARQTDPLGADEAWNYFQHIKGQKADAERQLSEREWTRSQQAQHDAAKRLEETQAYAKKLPGWTPQMDSEVIGFAKAKGVHERDLAGVMSPQVYEILNLARLGEQLLSKQNRPAAPPAQQQVPLTIVGAKSNPPARKDLASMSMEEYVAARRAGRKG